MSREVWVIESKYGEHEWQVVAASSIKERAGEQMAEAAAKWPSTRYRVVRYIPEPAASPAASSGTPPLAFTGSANLVEGGTVPMICHYAVPQQAVPPDSASTSEPAEIKDPADKSVEYPAAEQDRNVPPYKTAEGVQHCDRRKGEQRKGLETTRDLTEIGGTKVYSTGLSPTKMRGQEFKPDRRTLPDRRKP